MRPRKVSCTRPFMNTVWEGRIFTYKNRHGIKVHMSVAAYLNFPLCAALWIPKEGRTSALPKTTTRFPYKWFESLHVTSQIFHWNIINIMSLNLIFIKCLKRFSVMLLRSRQCQSNFAYFGLNYLISFTGLWRLYQVLAKFVFNLLFTVTFFCLFWVC